MRLYVTRGNRRADFAPLVVATGGDVTLKCGLGGYTSGPLPHETSYLV